MWFYTYEKRLEKWLVCWSSPATGFPKFEFLVTTANDTEMPEFCQFPKWSSFLQEIHQLDRAQFPISLHNTEYTAEFNGSEGESGSLLGVLQALL